MFLLLRHLTFLVSSLLLISRSVIGAEYRISNVNNFSDFVKNVNCGIKNYKRDTIYLDSDLSLSDITESIGTDSSNYFQGTFDGQGHIINNLKIESPTQYAGLFGYSTGLTVKNVILGSSCSITSSYSSGNLYVGGIIGYCTGQCSIENNVNMANISFNISINSHTVYLGGLASYLVSSDTYVNNCANYGPITYSGTSGKSYIGGILGYSEGLSSTSASSSGYVYIQNCLNYGAITHSGATSSTSELFIGGIIGANRCSEICNTLSAGKVSVNKNEYIGSITGHSFASTSLKHCFWTSDVGHNNSYDSISTQLDPSSELVNKLNGYSTTKSWNRWLLNMNSASVSFKINGGNGFIISSQVILLPAPVSNGECAFDGWYTDESLTSPFTISEVSSATTLYGSFCGISIETYTVTFDANGGNTPSKASMTVTFDSTYGDLAMTSRTGYDFKGWFTLATGGTQITKDSKVTTNADQTLYAQWTAKAFTVTLNPNGGAVSPTSTTVTFDSTYGTLPTPTRTGYAFGGWYTDAVAGTKIESNIKVTSASDHSIYAHWSKNDETDPPSGKSKKSVPTGLILGIAIPIVIIIIALIIFVLFILCRRKKETKVERMTRVEFVKPLVGRDEEGFRNSRIVSMSRNEAKVVKISSEDINKKSILTGLYPQNYVRPKMIDALVSAGVAKEQAELMSFSCENFARNNIAAEKNGNIGSLTLEDIAAIAMYTYDFGEDDFEHNPYRIINNGLSGDDDDSSKLKKVSGVLYLVMTALRKMPRYSARTLYRGVKGDVKINDKYYRKGNVITWTTLTSTSSDMEATKRFLSDESDSEKTTGTLFIIEDGWGYNIQPYSLCPDEEEIILEPERRFMVNSVIQSEDLVFINLEMLDTPLSLTDVFGEGMEY